MFSRITDNLTKFIILVSFITLSYFFIGSYIFPKTQVGELSRTDFDSYCNKFQFYETTNPSYEYNFKTWKCESKKPKEKSFDINWDFVCNEKCYARKITRKSNWTKCY